MKIYKQNRLNLDFALELRSQRKEFLDKYLSTIRFTPTEDELNTMAQYLLWGKDDITGLNGRQEGIELETRFGTWDGNDKTESLEALLESPGFYEGYFHSFDDVPTKIDKTPFSREEARKFASPKILQQFESLWEQIDQTEYIIGKYDLAHNKRTKPLRQELLNNIKSEDIPSLDRRVENLKSYGYLKLRHELVEMRTQQYQLRDSYCQVQPSFHERTSAPSEPIKFGEDVNVKPVGLDWGGEIGKKIFNGERFPEPKDFTAPDLKVINELIWHEEKDSTKLTFDFRDEKQLYNFFGMFGELKKN